MMLAQRLHEEQSKIVSHLENNRSFIWRWKLHLQEFNQIACKPGLSLNVILSEMGKVKWAFCFLKSCFCEKGLILFLEDILMLLVTAGCFNFKTLI